MIFAMVTNILSEASLQYQHIMTFLQSALTGHTSTHQKPKCALQCPSNVSHRSQVYELKIKI